MPAIFASNKLPDGRAFTRYSEKLGSLANGPYYHIGASGSLAPAREFGVTGNPTATWHPGYTDRNGTIRFPMPITNTSAHLIRMYEVNTSGNISFSTDIELYRAWVQNMCVVGDVWYIASTSEIKRGRGTLVEVSAEFADRDSEHYQCIIGGNSSVIVTFKYKSSMYGLDDYFELYFYDANTLNLVKTCRVTKPEECRGDYSWSSAMTASVYVGGRYAYVTSYNDVVFVIDLDNYNKLPEYVNVEVEE